MRLPSLPGSPQPAAPSPEQSPSPLPADDATAPQAVITTDTDDEGMDEATISLAALRARTAAPEGPTLQAVHCPVGHPNPPYAERCRLCDEQITGRAVSTVARPVLGVLRFDDGTEVEVTGPLVLGRRPAEDRVVDGEPATPVTLDDPDKVLSRTHAEVHIHDWQVQVVDRDSMNHTFVELPGQEPFRLPPAEPFAIVPGTKVSLGEQVNATFEVPDA